jgi:hypothetical protein
MCDAVLLVWRADEVGSEALSFAEVHLQRWSTELIDWPYANSIRGDIRLSPDSSRFGGPVTQTMLALAALLLPVV